MPVKKHFIPVAIVVVAAAATFAVLSCLPRGVVQNKENQEPQEQVVLAPVAFHDAAGKDVRLEDFAGKVLVVNLWATWCPPCVAELPALDRLQAKLADKGLHVIAISMDGGEAAEARKKVAGFLDAREVERIAVYHDGRREIMKNWRYQGLPVTFLIGRDGKVLRQFEGPQAWDEGDLFKQIEDATR